MRVEAGMFAQVKACGGAAVAVGRGGIGCFAGVKLAVAGLHGEFHLRAFATPALCWE